MSPSTNEYANLEDKDDFSNLQVKVRGPTSDVDPDMVRAAINAGCTNTYEILYYFGYDDRNHAAAKAAHREIIKALDTFVASGQIRWLTFA